MIMAFKENLPTLLIRYFVEPSLAEAWVDETVAGKHEE